MVACGLPSSATSALDRYLEIDPARAEVSIETGLPVHNVMESASPTWRGRHGAQ